MMDRSNDPMNPPESRIQMTRVWKTPKFIPR